MFVSNYPRNLLMGDVEFMIIRKLLKNEELSDSEDLRAEQMSNTIERMMEKRSSDRSKFRRIRHEDHHRSFEAHFDEQPFDDSDEVVLASSPT